MTAAPEWRPIGRLGELPPGDPGPGAQIEHQVLAKVLPAGEPMVATWWTCSICGFSQRGGPPARCQFNAEPSNCPAVAPSAIPPAV